MLIMQTVFEYISVIVFLCKMQIEQILQGVRLQVLRKNAGTRLKLETFFFTDATDKIEI